MKSTLPQEKRDAQYKFKYYLKINFPVTPVYFDIIIIKKA